MFSVHEINEGQAEAAAVSSFQISHMDGCDTLQLSYAFDGLPITGCARHYDPNELCGSWRTL